MLTNREQSIILTNALEKAYAMNNWLAKQLEKLTDVCPEGVRQNNCPARTDHWGNPEADCVTCWKKAAEKAVHNADRK